MSVLNNILEKKRTAIIRAKEHLPLAEIKRMLVVSEFDERIFLKQLKEKKQDIKIIAEIKKTSPSKGDILNGDTDVAEIAKLYQDNGASAISVLTEEDFFKGTLEDLKNVKKHTNLPVLRKDFIVDEYQVYESRFFKADAILLIAKILDFEELKKLSSTAYELKMDVLFEIHDRDDLDKVLELNPEIVGVNNRNLNTLETDIDISTRLLPLIPEGVFKISESAIKSYNDILYLRSLGADAFLIGESILAASDSASKIRSFLGYGQS